MVINQENSRLESELPTVPYMYGNLQQRTVYGNRVITVRKRMLIKGRSKNYFQLESKYIVVLSGVYYPELVFLSTVFLLVVYILKIEVFLFVVRSLLFYLLIIFLYSVVQSFFYCFGCLSPEDLILFLWSAYILFVYPGM